MDAGKIGKFIKEQRIKNHLTQSEFAQKYGVTYQAVSKWENGLNLPDIALLKEMSEDFHVNIDDLLSGEVKKNKRNKNIYYLGLVILLVILIIIVLTKNNSGFSFKTISTTCSEFKVTGSLAYDSRKSSIHISNIDYCGGEDNIVYDNITCELYEEENGEKNLISRCNKDGKNQKLEDYLKEVEVSVDDYEQKCKSYSHNSIYLEILASIGNKTTSYKIDLSLNNNCPSEVK